MGSSDDNDQHNNLLQYMWRSNAVLPIVIVWPVIDCINCPMLGLS